MQKSKMTIVCHSKKTINVRKVPMASLTLFYC